MTVESFDKSELIKCGNGELFEGDMRLPVDQMLMLDRITHISDEGEITIRACSLQNSTSIPISGSSNATSRATRLCPDALVWMPSGS